MLTNAYKGRIIFVSGEDMKRRDLIKLLEKNGWTLLRDGGRHDIYTNGEKEEPIPCHKEINEILAQKIIKKHGLK